MYIYIYFYTSFSSRPILFHILRLELTIFSERILSFRGKIIKIVFDDIILNPSMLLQKRIAVQIVCTNNRVAHVGMDHLSHVPSKRVSKFQ